MHYGSEYGVASTKKPKKDPKIDFNAFYKQKYQQSVLLILRVLDL